MCGIAGIVSLGAGPVAEAADRISRMMRLLRHRGPDSAGSWVSDDGRVVLANTRLSIVGVQDDIELPMRSEDGLSRLTYNGEVYNYRELRDGLSQKGLAFRTGTDTEVLLAGLQRQGVEFVERADGVWSFGYYDKRNNSLTLARDLMGEKSLYYCLSGDELLFASEVSPILAAMNSNPDWDQESIACAFQYRAAPPGRTLFRQVERLLPGHALTVTPGDRRLGLRRVQRLRPEKWHDFFAGDPTPERVLERLEEMLSLACERRLPDEVDYISTLSGGIDSTLINVFLSDRGRRSIDSLYGHSTLESPQRGNDLSEYEASCLTAEKLGTNHHEFVMHGEDAIDLYRQDAADCFDGIFCEAATNFRQLARQARMFGKRVLVTSDGPDELLGGYDVDVRALQLANRFGKFPGKTRDSLIDRAFDMDHMNGKSSSLLNWAYLETEPFAVRPNHCGTRPGIMAALFDEDLVEARSKQFGRIDAGYEDQAAWLDLPQKMALGYACSSLPDYFNTRSDRGTMRESVELRLPFQAPYVAELLIAIPAKLRSSTGTRSKSLLRTLVQRHIGDAVAFRGKYGFAQPIWRIQERARQLAMRETVADSGIFGAFEFRRGARDLLLSQGQERHLWMAYCLARSYERAKQEFFDSKAFHAGTASVVGG